MFTRSPHYSSLAVALCLALTATVFAGSTAQATDTQDPPTRVVRFADLNLNTTAGINALYKRLRGASRAVCAGFVATDFMVGQQTSRNPKWQACYDQAMAGAIAKINNPSLTALHGGSHNKQS